MTISEVERELADLAPREAAAWEAVKERMDERDKAHSALLAQLNAVHPEAQKDLERLSAAWTTLNLRRTKLEAFLELSK
jgi:hypothetical protein